MTDLTADSAFTFQVIEAIKSIKEAQPFYKDDWFISLAGVFVGALITWVFTYRSNKRQDRKDKEKAKQELINQLIVIRANTESMIVYIKDCAYAYLMSFQPLRQAVLDNQYIANQTFNTAQSEYSKAQAEFLKQCSLFTGLIDDDTELKALMDKCIKYVINPESPAVRIGIENTLIDKIVKPTIKLMENKIDALRK